MKYTVAAGLIGLLSLTVGCQNPSESETTAEVSTTTETPVSRHPEWVKNASIYEVNIRQYSQEGTINAFRQHLPRLQKLGVDVLWIMPIQPIGVKNRKVDNEGDPGSYYSISNYTAVNPDYGTAEDFKAMVGEAHALGMKVILDWVANHTAWDHHWTEEHPEWYTADSLGNRPIVPIDGDGNATDWEDVADLNYDEQGLRDAMTASMMWWLDNMDLDGFRCDVAGFVPYDFWAENNKALREARDGIFMLAEWEDERLQPDFDMDYGWEFHHIMNEVAQGHEPVSALRDYQTKLNEKWQKDDIRMYFTTNHDENSWNGTVYERMGDAHKTYFVLASTYEKGMPLIYSGQEVGLDRRLSFFGKDQIDWVETPLSEFYAQMMDIKGSEATLANGAWGGDMSFIETPADSAVLGYYRTLDSESLGVLLNLKGEAQSWETEISPKDILISEGVEFTDGKVSMAPYAYIVWK